MRIGIDLGGTKIEVIALDSDGKELLRRRVATPRVFEESIAAIAGLVRDTEAELGHEGTVGVGIPGVLSPATGLVKNANSTWLNGQELDRALSQALSREVRLQNDANCFCLSEATDGAAKEASLVFGVILGTGVGGAIVWDRKVWTGKNANGGEWGHNPLPWPTDDERPGPACFCGRRGCNETYLAGPSLERTYQEAGGEARSATDIARLADSGDVRASEVLEHYMHRLARALANIVNVLDPDVVVLGGGVSNIQRLYERVPELWDQFVFSDRVDTQLVQARHGDSSGVRGAAWLWPETKDR